MGRLRAGLEGVEGRHCTVDAYDTQLRKYNELVDKFNVLNAAYDQAQTEKAAAVSELEATQVRARRTSDCVDRADTIESAKACF
ncbi:MAG: hypothetical protein E5W82_28940 [Mesorhizobium sp.]|nr:MAG: hypothetical protein E5W82_28940 [Mesorhizobium sp.]